MTVGTTNFPGSLDSHVNASPLGFGEVNNQAYTLSTAAHTAAVTTLTVASTSKFSSKGFIVVKRELISYTGKTSTTFTGCTRGVGGTTAAAFLSGTLVEQVPVDANHNDLAAAIVAIETAMGARLATLTRKNRVINGDMRVQQRTTLGSTDDSFTLDRWTLLLEAATAATVTQETSDVPTDGSKYGLKLTVGASNNNKFGIATYLEFRDVADLRGKTVSLQAKLKASDARIGDVRMAVLEWTGTADTLTSDVVSSWGSAGTNPTLAASWAYLGTPANLSPTTSWATYRVEGLTVGASANNLAVLIWCDDKTTTAGDTLTITDVQLEEGPTCSGVERRPFAQELQLCQRYFEAAGGSGGLFDCFGLGAWVSTTDARIIFYFQTRKRTTPAVSVSSVTHLKLTYLTSWAGDIETSAVSTAYGGVTAIALDVDVGSAVGTAGHPCMLFAASTASARVFFSAEL